MPTGRGLFRKNATANTSLTPAEKQITTDASKRGAADIGCTSDSSSPETGAAAKKPMRKKNKHSKKRDASNETGSETNESGSEETAYVLKPDRPFFNLTFSDLKQMKVKTSEDGKTEVRVSKNIRPLPNFCLKYMQIEIVQQSGRTMYMKPMNDHSKFTTEITKSDTSMNTSLEIKDWRLNFKSFRMPLKFYETNESWKDVPSKTYGKKGFSYDFEKNDAEPVKIAISSGTGAWLIGVSVLDTVVVRFIFLHFIALW